ncbi:IMP cyclohydrolase /phosphoribosylaminoimidazolecarboxamide formyltransferase [Thermoplasmatales archaeon BRNA1]|nr:IMP cyclohydrolase /phosphoribosylaminoimidazolecarboxamide formyltransferase [Thermoplasmatales archaeon BRNA1]
MFINGGGITFQRCQQSRAAAGGISLVKIKRAIISVSDKTGIVEFAKKLEEYKVEIISTGGTYKLLKDNGVKVKEVSEVTGFPEMLDGRVKTLHPFIHAGILARRDVPEHMKAIKDMKIQPVDMIVVNLYPFRNTVLKEGVSMEEIIENIDIGGPSMIRAAAKNWQSVAVVTDPKQYGTVTGHLIADGEIPEFILKRFMAQAFTVTAQYDAMVSQVMQKSFGNEMFPSFFPQPCEKVADLRYGENPNQKAAFYKDPFTKGCTVANAQQLGGKQLSYNNIIDLDKALDIVLDFERPTAVVMKHTNPCGLASDETISKAFRTAYDVDPISAFGCVIALNRECDAETATMIHEYFVEAVIAPSFTQDALDVLRLKKGVRILATNMPIGPDTRIREMKVRRVQGGVLVQTDEDIGLNESNLKVVTKRAPTKEEVHSLLFAWKLAKHVMSNAVVYVRGEHAVGIGAGQMSRVDSAKIAGFKAREPTKGCVMASDAFFPFRDAVDAAAEAGITAIIQPGGSIRDQESIDAANEHGIAMVYTGCRVFRHS